MAVQVYTGGILGPGGSFLAGGAILSQSRTGWYVLAGEIVAASISVACMGCDGGTLSAASVKALGVMATIGKGALVGEAVGAYKAARSGEELAKGIIIGGVTSAITAGVADGIGHFLGGYLPEADQAIAPFIGGMFGGSIGGTVEALLEGKPVGRSAGIGAGIGFFGHGLHELGPPAEAVSEVVGYELDDKNQEHHKKGHDEHARESMTTSPATESVLRASPWQPYGNAGGLGCQTDLSTGKVSCTSAGR